MIVLTYEFDKPIQDTIFKAGKDVVSILDFVQQFVGNLFKSNVYVERALFNDCLKLCGMLSGGINNLKYFDFLDLFKYY